ncbi:MAG: 4-hydroxy-tetrahydrodipicolinate synthase [Acidobacteriota bacterium]|nr:4-hydroxy-tetrahydrodipicolinate synthase [Acidobacteriota bacterium]
MVKLRGCGTAIVTPFQADGAIDEKALRALVAWQIESGIDFLVPCGTTGETPTLSHEEWRKVIEITIEVAGGRVPIIAGATSNCTAEAASKAREISSLKGVDFVLSASPYYNKPTQEGQYLHFKAVSEASLKPVVVYNVPGRTGVNLLPETLRRLVELPNFAAVKEASGMVTQIAEICASLPDFTVLSGDDAMTLPAIAVGGSGVISVASNVFPKEMADLTRAALNDDWTHARTLYKKFLPLMQAHFIESNPLPVKAVLAMMGRIQEVYRLPLCPMQPSLRAKLETIARAAGVVQ